MIVLGIDVGVAGAVAALDDDGSFLSVDDLPLMVHGRAKWIDGQALLSRLLEIRNGRSARAVVEHIHAMPGMGSVAANSKGMTMGSVLVTLQIAGVAIELVTPQTWKRDLGLLQPKATDGDKKRASLSKARMLFPTAELDRQKDHNRAESLLLAHWATRREWSKAA